MLAMADALRGRTQFRPFSTANLMKLGLGHLLCKTQGWRFFLTITVKLRRIRMGNMVNITNGRSDNSASLAHPLNGSSTYLIMPKRSSRRHANRLAATSFVTNTGQP